MPDFDSPTTPPEETVDQPAPEATNEERTMAMLCHLLGFLTSFIGPLIIWLIKKDEMPFVDDQGKESLNFQITILLASIVSGLLACVIIGIFLAIAVGIADLVYCIIAAIKSNEGQRYRYPFCLRLIK